MRIDRTDDGFLSLMSVQPGVYKYFDDQESLLYVGKAKNLKKRITSYFTKNHPDAKTRILVRKIRFIELIIVDSELDALLLENNLIKENKPRYNILLKDDKTYPWICLKKEPYPRIFSTRNRFNSKDEYYGPYPKGKIHKQLLEIIHDLYPIRTCSLDLSHKTIQKKAYKVCLEFHLKRCIGPCVNSGLEEDYSHFVDEIRFILKGRTHVLIQKLKSEMAHYATSLEFELAQKVKLKINALEQYHAKSAMVNNPNLNCDVLSFIKEGETLYYNYSWVREGRIDFSHSNKVALPKEEIMEELALTLWHELKLKFGSNERDIITNIDGLNEIDGFKFHFPQRGDKLKILAFSIKNARIVNPIDKPKKVDNGNTRVEHLQRILNLPISPQHIECFDNSNFQGTHAVAACVVFKDGMPDKDSYRHFNIKTVVGPDDFASMREIVHRRYARILNENKTLPNLIVIDGGKGQLSAALDALEQLNIRGKVAIIGLAKRLEEVYFPGDNYPLLLNINDPGMHLLQHIRNEAHRFGITHHRNKRSKHFIHSEFSEIQGIGPKAMEKIMKHFPSMNAFRKAEIEQQNALLGEALAQKIRAYKD